MKNKFTLILAFMLGSLIVANAQVNLNNGLVANYPFNGNANDASASGVNSTVIGASLTTDRFGISNAAYTFDGIGNYINLGNSTVTQFANVGTTTSTFTESAWIYTESNSVQMIIAHGVSSYGLYLQTVNPNFYI